MVTTRRFNQYILVVFRRISWSHHKQSLLMRRIANKHLSHCDHVCQIPNLHKCNYNADSQSIKETRLFHFQPQLGHMDWHGILKVKKLYQTCLQLEGLWPRRFEKN